MRATHTTAQKNQQNQSCTAAFTHGSGENQGGHPSTASFASPPHYTAIHHIYRPSSKKIISEIECCTPHLKIMAIETAAKPASIRPAKKIINQHQHHGMAKYQRQINHRKSENGAHCTTTTTLASRKNQSIIKRQRQTSAALANQPTAPPPHHTTSGEINRQAINPSTPR